MEPVDEKKQGMMLIAGSRRNRTGGAFVGGLVGTGKTHLAIALGITCCQRDYR